MIPYVLDFIEMHERGEFPLASLAAYAMKKISEMGEQADFDSLPDWLKDSIRDEVEKYKETGVWVIISTGGTQRYENYAEKFLEKIDMGKR